MSEYDDRLKAYDERYKGVHKEVRDLQYDAYLNVDGSVMDKEAFEARRDRLLKEMDELDTELKALMRMKGAKE